VSARRKFDMAVLRKAIEAGVKAHDAGKSLPSEMPVWNSKRREAGRKSHIPIMRLLVPPTLW
jgi:hypothetical protein